MNEQKYIFERKKLRAQINGKFNNTAVSSLSQAEIQGLHPAEANLGYFLAWFQSFHLPSTQSESPLALIPLAPKSHVSFKACTRL
jgi:hypothetical protein